MSPGDDLRLKPTVRWSREMTAGQPHLIEVDLVLVDRTGAPSADWPFDEEELGYTCTLVGGSDFDLWAVHDGGILVHRFGGSYGPAQFVVTPVVALDDGPSTCSLWLTIASRWGVDIGGHELKVLIRASGGGPDQPPAARDKPNSVAVAASIKELVEAAAASSPTDLGIVHRDPAAVGPSPAAEPDDEEHGRFSGAAVRPTAPDVGPQPFGPPPPAQIPDPPRPSARLMEYYSVATLRRHHHGYLDIDLVPLFGPGAEAGDQVTFTAFCLSSDERGTVFAAFAAPTSGPDAEPRVLFTQSAKFPPGAYQVTAELLYPYPGHLRFRGLPVPLGEDPRRWEEIAAAVPRRLLRGVGPVHLVAAIEISGPPAVVRQRVERITWLIRHVADTAEDPAFYSIVTYGPHSINSHNRTYPEVPVTTLAWAETASSALRTMARLARRGADPVGYPAAAQLECVLTDLARELTGHEGRPVLVTAGGRPPHPRALDPVSGIIPCHERNDWRSALARLRAGHPGMGFGAIHDSGWPDELWRQLGLDVASTLDEFYAPDFADSLGLTGGPIELHALPMILQ